MNSIAFEDDVLSIQRLKSSFVFVYIDDILVFSYTLQEHIKHLEFVFEKLISHGLIVSKKKLKLIKTFFLKIYYIS